MVGLVFGVLSSVAYERWSKTANSQIKIALLVGFVVVGVLGSLWLAARNNSDPGDTETVQARPAEMFAELTAGDFVCDDQSRLFFSLSNALPGERIRFDQDMNPPISPVLADEHGRAPVPYSCPSTLPRRVWTVSATSASGRSAYFQVTASPPEEAVGAPTQPVVQLVPGPPAPAGYFYSVSLLGFTPGSRVEVTCHDSVDSAGFYTRVLTVDSSGAASDPQFCYSGDGPDHWIVADGRESTRVAWPSTPGVIPPSAPSGQVTGAAANTWTNYLNAGGSQGPTIPAGSGVDVECRIEGFAVPNGNRWWYRIASPPWSSEYYASADVFYNNGQSSGALRGTPFMDPAVPLC